LFKKSALAFPTLLFALVFCAQPSHSLENIVFGSTLGASAQISASSFLKEDFQTTLSAYEAARVDLNDDGIDEIILRETNCRNNSAPCAHIVLAHTNDQIFKLSEFQAKYIMLAGTYSHGIRDILAFRDKKNDYNFDLYIWDSHKGQYKLELEKKAAKVEE